MTGKLDLRFVRRRYKRCGLAGLSEFALEGRERRVRGALMFPLDQRIQMGIVFRAHQVLQHHHRFSWAHRWWQ